MEGRLPSNVFYHQGKIFVKIPDMQLLPKYLKHGFDRRGDPWSPYGGLSPPSNQEPPPLPSSLWPSHIPKFSVRFMQFTLLLFTNTTDFAQILPNIEKKLV